MSTDGGLDLGGYLSRLIDDLSQAEPTSGSRQRHVVGARRARIMLDDEAVTIGFVDGVLQVRPAETGLGEEFEVDGEGRTTTATVLRLLDAEIEVTDAILSGEIDVRGSPDGLARILHAIEILLEGSTRIPQLRALAAAFRAAPRPQVDERPAPGPRPDRETELQLIRRLDLLP